MSERPLPKQISRAGQGDIRIEWRDGHLSHYPASYLRFHCPCASCVDELTGFRILQKEDVAPEIVARSLKLVGRYAIRVYWSDGHSSGIYPFELLRRLCPCSQCSDQVSSGGS